MSGSTSLYVATLEALAARGVPFVLVGVGGINFYAKDASSSVATRDLDLYLPSDREALRAALEVLVEHGYTLSAGGEPFVDVDDDAVLAGVLRARAAIHASGPGSTELDLTFGIAGYEFTDLITDAVAFQVGEADVHVGRLDKLLRSKELADRPKDRQFLRMYRAYFETDLEDPTRA